MVISTKSRYGLRALVDLVLHYKGKPVFLKDIAEREELSLRYLENIFTRLRTAGILKSCKGKGGGFFPARDPKDIQVLDIVEILEDSTAFSSCIDAPSSCKRSNTCISRDVWVSINNSFRESLASITIDDLIKRHNRENEV